jgi:hypothetical protein
LDSKYEDLEKGARFEYKIATKTQHFSQFKKFKFGLNWTAKARMTRDHQPAEQAGASLFLTDDDDLHSSTRKSKFGP